jgi:hypothetical protein
VPTKPGGEDWRELFNGKDLTGWKPHPDFVGNWRVEDGILIGSGPTTGYLMSERSDLENFHLRLETRIARGDSGVIFRASGQFQPAKQPNLFRPIGYEVQIVGGKHTFATGSLLGYSSRKALSPSPKPNEWFTLDIVAQDNHLVVKIDDQVTATDMNARRIPGSQDSDQGHVGADKAGRCRRAFRCGQGQGVSGGLGQVSGRERRDHQLHRHEAAADPAG